MKDVLKFTKISNGQAYVEVDGTNVTPDELSEIVYNGMFILRELDETNYKAIMSALVELFVEDMIDNKR